MRWPADWASEVQVQLEPLEKQLGIVKLLSFPPCPPLEEWERTATPAMRALAMDVGPPGGAKGSGTRGGAAPAPMPLAGETTVEAKLLEAGGGAGREGGGGAEQPVQKVIPVWARTEAMELSAAQRGEAPSEGNRESQEGAAGGSAEEEAEKKRLAAYYEAYYAALREQASTGDGEQEAEAKVVWDDEVEGEERDTVWEEGEGVGEKEMETGGEENGKGEELEWEEG